MAISEDSPITATFESSLIEKAGAMVGVWGVLLFGHFSLTTDNDRSVLLAPFLVTLSLITLVYSFRKNCDKKKVELASQLFLFCTVAAIWIVNSNEGLAAYWPYAVVVLTVLFFFILHRKSGVEVPPLGPALLFCVYYLPSEINPVVSVFFFVFIVLISFSLATNNDLHRPPILTVLALLYFLHREASLIAYTAIFLGGIVITFIYVMRMRLKELGTSDRRYYVEELLVITSLSIILDTLGVAESATKFAYIAFIFFAYFVGYLIYSGLSKRFGIGRLIGELREGTQKTRNVVMLRSLMAATLTSLCLSVSNVTLMEDSNQLILKMVLLLILGMVANIQTS